MVYVTNFLKRASRPKGREAVILIQGRKIRHTVDPPDFTMPVILRRVMSARPRQMVSYGSAESAAIKTDRNSMTSRGGGLPLGSTIAK